MTRREALGDQPAVILRAAQDLGAVALDDERDLQPVILPSTSPRRVSIAAGAKSCRRRRCPSSTRSRNAPIVYEQAERLGGELEILGREQHAGAAERLGNGAGGVGQHRHVRRHGLDERHAEALVLAERDVDVRPAVERAEILVGTGPVNQNRSGSIWNSRDQRPDLRVVARHAVVAADEDEAVVAVDVALVELGEPDVILDPLVRDDAADEEDVDQAVAEDLLQRRPRAARR